MKAKVHLPLQHPMVSSSSLSSDPRGEEETLGKTPKILQLDLRNPKSPPPPPPQRTVWLAGSPGGGSRCSATENRVQPLCTRRSSGE
ncbi:hypothetical protein VZT92_011118 [Zoarces viviparus]|uniref:Uncharacterized protein n=1 Tax=Zoarces viviparus TaxID=48416 RepID=A0AAW1F9Y3_ZOAVI